MEKRKPHYDLGTIKASFTTVSELRITKTALLCSEALGLTLADIVSIIQIITREHFYKSMTSHYNSAIWQDVYHLPLARVVLYVKFTTDAEGYLVLSLKEK